MNENLAHYLRVELDITVTDKKLAEHVLERADNVAGDRDLADELAAGIEDGRVEIDQVRMAYNPVEEAVEDWYFTRMERARGDEGPE